MADGTKTAQIALARGLAETTAWTGVTVNSVLPGPAGSEGVEQFVQDLAKGQGTGAAPGGSWPAVQRGCCT